MLDVTLEITPPAAPRPRVLLRRARSLGRRARLVNVISRPDRWSSLEACAVLLERGIEPVWHLVNRGRSAAAIEAELERARAMGLRRVLCIRGEHKARDDDDTPKIREVVRMVRQRLPGAVVSVTLNQHYDPRRALANLWPKLEAGASGVQTQCAFELASLRPAAEALKARHPEVSLVPMLLPLLSAPAARRAGRRLSVPIPARTLQRLERFGEPAGWEHFRGLVEEASRASLFDGVAVVTPIDPSPEFAGRLHAALA